MIRLRSAAARLALRVGLVAVILASAAVPSPAAAAVPVRQSAASQAAELALAITTPGSLEAQIGATRQALALGGIATADGSTVRVPATEPAASMQVSSHESARLTIEARERATAGRLTAAQLAQQLQDFGWVFREDSTPADQMVAFLAAWVNAAQGAPEDPESFTPLFLAAMAQQQQPPVDLASGTINPDELRLTLLELQLLAAAFDRSVAKVPGGDMAEAEVPGQQRAALLAAAPLGQADPCTEFKKRLGTLGRQYLGPGAGDVGDAWGEVGVVGFGEGVGKILDVSVGAALNPALEAAGASPHANFGNAMSALGSAAKIWKLISFYANEQSSVTATTYETHRAQPQPGEKYVLYTARAGVSQEEYDEYLRAVGGEAASETEQAVKDCLNAAGMPTPTELVDLANDAEKWRAKWDVTPYDGEHVSIHLAGSVPKDWENQFDILGSMQMRFARSSATTAEADFRLVINKEDAALHDSPNAVEKVANYQVCAEVRAAQMPGLGTLVNAGKGGLGLVDALVELGAGWLQEMLPPEACAPLAVSYHEEGGTWTGQIRHTEWGTETTTDVRQLTGNPSGTQTTTLSERRSVEGRFQVRTGEETSPFTVTLRGVSTATGEHQREVETIGQGTDDCGQVAGRRPWAGSGTTRATESGTVSADSEVRLAILPDGTYSVDYDFPELQLEGTFFQRGFYQGACNPFSDFNSTETTGSAYATWLRPLELTGTVDPENPGTISGSASDVYLNGGMEVNRIVTWEFRRTE